MVNVLYLFFHPQTDPPWDSLLTRNPYKMAKKIIVRRFQKNTKRVEVILYFLSFFSIALHCLRDEKIPVTYATVCKVFVVCFNGGCPCEGFTFSMVYFPVDGIRKDRPPSAWYSKGFLPSFLIVPYL